MCIKMRGKIPWELGVWYGCMAFAGAIIGQLALAEFIKRTGRASIAVLILAVMEVSYPSYSGCPFLA